MKIVLLMMRRRTLRMTMLKDWFLVRNLQVLGEWRLVRMEVWISMAFDLDILWFWCRVDNVRFWMGCWRRVVVMGSCTGISVWLFMDMLWMRS